MAAGLLNSLTWQRIAEVEHLSDMRPSDYAQAVAYVAPATDGLLCSWQGAGMAQAGRRS